MTRKWILLGAAATATSAVTLIVVRHKIRRRKAAQHQSDTDGTEGTAKKAKENFIKDGHEIARIPAEFNKLESNGAVFGPIICGFSKHLEEGDDILTEGLLKTATATLGFIEALGGAATVFAKRDFKGNMVKVQKWFDANREKHRTLRSFLEAEKAIGVHKPGGVLAQDSGAMGLLWIRRNFEFFQRLAVNLAKDREITAVSAAMKSYQESFAKHHGYLVQTMFKYVFSLLPQRDDFFKSCDLDPNYDVYAPVCRIYAEVSGTLNERLRALQEELDLEDPTVV